MVSKEPAASRELSGLKARLLTAVLKRTGSPRGRPVFSSKSKTWWAFSAVPAASSLPSGLKARHWTIEPPSSGGRIGRPVATSQRWTAPSKSPVARTFPSGENTSRPGQFVSGNIGVVETPVATSKIRQVDAVLPIGEPGRSKADVAKRSPTGPIATEATRGQASITGGAIGCPSEVATMRTSPAVSLLRTNRARSGPMTA